MKKRIKNLYEKYRDMIPYAVFGVLTTVVNYISYWFCTRILSLETVPATVISWVLAVLFAYVTNRKWVFHSEAKGAKEIIREIIYFFGCRLATGVLDWVGMYVTVDLLHWNDLIMKIAINIVVIILNYVAGKLLIFRKKK